MVDEKQQVKAEIQELGGIAKYYEVLDSDRPVFITRHGRDEYVIVSLKMYEGLLDADTRLR